MRNPGQEDGVGTTIMVNYDCPTCRKVITVDRKEDAPHRPFCCHRCKMVDLGRWFDGTYRINEPAGPEDLEQASPDDEQV